MIMDEILILSVTLFLVPQETNSNKMENVINSVQTILSTLPEKCMLRIHAATMMERWIHNLKVAVLNSPSWLSLCSLVINLKL